MKEIILIKNGELTLKGLNRSSFEDVLIKNMKARLHTLGEFIFDRAQSTISIEPKSDGIDIGEAVERLKKVFGIVGIARAAACEKDFEVIKKTAGEYLADELSAVRTFKVEAKRADKHFPLNSPQISAELGGYLLERFPHLQVDVHEPDMTVVVEVRDRYAYIRGNQIKGAGGMPSRTGGRAALLISGGIDSPVAGYMLAKRGMELVAVHFASPPYTSPLAHAKVCRLLEKVSVYSGPIKLYTVHFTEIQEAIRDFCPEEFFTIVMRRYMMSIASKIAQDEECSALITGESVGQVASQTVWAIRCTDEMSDLPVFRPLIGMDKDEIVRIARQIDTFDISIEPYEDCCTVFTPRHPKTRPTQEAARDAHALVSAHDLPDLQVEVRWINPDYSF